MRAEKLAVENERQAKESEARARRLLYATSLNLMQQADRASQLSQMRALLEETSGYPGRGFEWYYWKGLCHQEQHRLIGHRDSVTSVAWSPNGQRLATGSKDGTAKVWDAVSGREERTFKGHTGPVESVAWSPDSQSLA